MAKSTVKKASSESSSFPHPKAGKIKKILSRLTEREHEITLEDVNAALHIFVRVLKALETRENQKPDSELPLTASVAITAIDAPSGNGPGDHDHLQIGNIDIDFLRTQSGDVIFLCN